MACNLDPKGGVNFVGVSKKPILAASCASTDESQAFPAECFEKGTAARTRARRAFLRMSNGGIVNVESTSRKVRRQSCPAYSGPDRARRRHHDSARGCVCPGRRERSAT